MGAIEGLLFGAGVVGGIEVSGRADRRATAARIVDAGQA
jgi:hypothetical protein